MSPSLTLTFGLGPGVFGDRFGLGARPAALRELPAFAGDALDPALCGGDLCVQACAEERAAALEAVERLSAAAGPRARRRWLQEGFLMRGPRDRREATPRDVLGFRGGTGNVRRGRDLDRHVWVTGRERSWMLGGTFLVVRRIRVDLAAWERLPVPEQELVIGRHKDSGAPLGRRGEFDAMPLDDDTIPADAHARLAARQTNAGAAFLRRGYSYEEGLVFLAFARDPRRQYVPMQRSLAERDALSRFTHHVGSAVFAIPPGARPGGFVGDRLFGARRRL